MPITKKLYLLGLFIIFASAYSQYLIGGFGPIVGIFIVYGVPLLATSMLWGSTIIRRAFNYTLTALKFGLGFFGAFTVLGTLAATAIFFIIVTFDPTAVSLLHRPNPVLNVPPEVAWIMVWFSLLVVGPVEEYLFRGFIYGGLLKLFKDRHWISLAFISSILFAAVHLYYAFVYGIVSLVQFTDLVTFGMAMAATYYLSGGNLLVPAMIHGAYDATGFIGVATSLDVGILLRGSMILIGIIVAIALLVQKILKRRKLHPIANKGLVNTRTASLSHRLIFLPCFSCIYPYKPKTDTAHNNQSHAPKYYRYDMTMSSPSCIYFSGIQLSSKLKYQCSKTDKYLYQEKSYPRVFPKHMLYTFNFL